MDRRAALNRHKMTLGMFAPNVSSGRVVSRLPERWHGTWQDNLKLAKIADAGGIDFILPLGRWKGYGGETDYQGETLETITWATGMLASTERITVFGTVHAPMFHPVAAAKQMVTADQIGNGRFGLNLVCGWNADEFEMFGADLREHDLRYAYAQEWLDIIKSIWTRRDAFDFKGQFFDLKGVIGKPKPVGGTLPMIMNAGASDVGRSFALRNCELFFTTPMESSIADAKRQASAANRHVDLFTVASVTCRKTKREAREFFDYTRTQNADWAAIDAMLVGRGMLKEGQTPEDRERMRRDLANGYGSPSYIGDPDDIALDLQKLSEAGIKGIGLEFFHYADELPFFVEEVIPRLVRLGLRQPN